MGEARYEGHTLLYIFPVTFMLLGLAGINSIFSFLSEPNHFKTIRALPEQGCVALGFAQAKLAQNRFNQFCFAKDCKDLTSLYQDQEGHGYVFNVQGDRACNFISIPSFPGDESHGSPLGNRTR